MKKIFLLSFILLIISINTQQQKNPEVNSAQKNSTKLGDNLNQKIPGKIINGTNDQNDFNLTEALAEFFGSLFGNSKNKTEKEKLAEKIKEEKKKKEQEILEQLNLEKEREEKRKREERQKKEKEREEFEKKIENITINEITNLYLEAKSGELLYHNTTKPCKIKIIFMLTDSERTIHMNFNGPNGKGGSTLIQSF